MEMTHLAQRLSRAFDIRYVAGLLLLAVLATLTFFLTFRLTSMEELRTEVVSMAANQRTLSQRIAFLSNAIVDADSEAEQEQLRQSLLKNLRQMETAHEILTGEDPAGDRYAHFVKSLSDIYFTGAMPFDEQVTGFIADARLIANSNDMQAVRIALTEVNAAGTNYIMQTHGLITRVLEYEAETSLDAMERAEALLWTVTLIFLVLEGLFIFRPMSRQIATSVDDMERAEERSAHLAKEAQRAEAARSRFFRAASHELRTPLNAILGLTEILKDKDKSGAYLEEVTQLEAGSQQLLHMVNNMLEMNRLGRDHVALKPTKANLYQDLRAVSDMYRVAMRDGQELKQEISPAADKLFEYDARRLRQVIGNILSTLSTFPEEGIITLRVEEAQQDKQKPTFSFAISHTGMPVTAAVLDVISPEIDDTQIVDVDSFFTLAIARNLIRHLGGKLQAREQEGGGTDLCFELSLPEVAKAVCGPNLEGRKVLVVDDNIPNQMVACAFLQSAGIETEIAGDGLAAVNKAAACAYDLILMDINMPVMDGVEATRKIRCSDNLSAAVPIVALTAHVQQDEISELLDAGMQEVIHKPINRDMLLDKATRWVGQTVLKESA